MIGLVIGTRPELIKLRPVAHELLRLEVPFRVLYTHQHAPIESEVWDLDPRRTALPIMLGEKFPRPSIDHFRLVVVQGDTSSARDGALQAAYEQIPIVHVEAGLRTRKIERMPAPATAPYPEEMNRQLIARLAALHLCPNESNFQNLLIENAGGKVVVTGNPGITAASRIIEKIRSTGTPSVPDVASRIVVTCHRRENWSQMKLLWLALHHLAAKLRPHVHITWILHPNPALALALPPPAWPEIEIVEPQGHAATLALIDGADLVATDSGGIIEEAVYVRQRLVVLRGETERPEANARLCPLDSPESVSSALLEELEKPYPMTERPDPHVFGDRNSAQRCAIAIRDFYRRM